MTKSLIVLTLLIFMLVIKSYATEVKLPVYDTGKERLTINLLVNKYETLISFNPEVTPLLDQVLTGNFNQDFEFLHTIINLEENLQEIKERISTYEEILNYFILLKTELQ